MADVALMDYDSLGSFQSGLGSAAVITMDKSVDMVHLPFHTLTNRSPPSATSPTSTCTNPAVNALLAVRACLGFTTSCAEWNVANWKKEKWTCWWRSVLKSNCTPSAVLPMLPSGLLKVWCVLGRRTFSRDANTPKTIIPKTTSKEPGVERNYNLHIVALFTTFSHYTVFTMFVLNQLIAFYNVWCEKTNPIISIKTEEEWYCVIILVWIRILLLGIVLHSDHDFLHSSKIMFSLSVHFN